MAIAKYKFRLPAYLTKHTNAIYAKLALNVTTATARSGAIGLSYALKICTKNGRIEESPVNWLRKNSAITIINGLIVCFRFNSENFSAKLGKGCKHLTFCLIHKLHAVDSSLCCFILLNSSATTSLDVQPRSQRSDFSASLTRFFDKSHCGVSGICEYSKVVDIIWNCYSMFFINSRNKLKISWIWVLWSIQDIWCAIAWMCSEILTEISQVYPKGKNIQLKRLECLARCDFFCKFEEKFDWKWSILELIANFHFIEMKIQESHQISPVYKATGASIKPPAY